MLLLLWAGEFLLAKLAELSQKPRHAAHAGRPSSGEDLREILVGIASSHEGGMAHVIDLNYQIPRSYAISLRSEYFYRRSCSLR